MEYRERLEASLQQAIARGQRHGGVAPQRILGLAARLNMYYGSGLGSALCFMLGVLTPEEVAVALWHAHQERFKISFFHRNPKWQDDPGFCGSYWLRFVRSRFFPYLRQMEFMPLFRDGNDVFVAVTAPPDRGGPALDEMAEITYLVDKQPCRVEIAVTPRQVFLNCLETFEKFRDLFEADPEELNSDFKLREKIIITVADDINQMAVALGGTRAARRMLQLVACLCSVRGDGLREPPGCYLQVLLEAFLRVRPVNVPLFFLPALFHNRCPEPNALTSDTYEDALVILLDCVDELLKSIQDRLKETAGTTLDSLFQNGYDAFEFFGVPSTLLRAELSRRFLTQPQGKVPRVTLVKPPMRIRGPQCPFTIRSDVFVRVLEEVLIEFHPEAARPDYCPISSYPGPAGNGSSIGMFGTAQTFEIGDHVYLVCESMVKEFIRRLRDKACPVITELGGAQLWYDDRFKSPREFFRRYIEKSLEVYRLVVQHSHEIMECGPGEFTFPSSGVRR